jgi:hypothetical protein
MSGRTITTTERSAAAEVLARNPRAIGAACRAAGCSRATLYRWKEEPSFAAEVLRAEERIAAEREERRSRSPHMNADALDPGRLLGEWRAVRSEPRHVREPVEVESSIIPTRRAD